MKQKIIIILMLCMFLGGIGVGYVLGTTYTVRAFAKSLDYIDSFELNVDINESKMVEAMIPYINNNLT